MLRSTAPRSAAPIVRHEAARLSSTPESTTAATDAPRPRRAIERHLDRFFDRNGDRKISLSETYTGVHDLGVGRAAAAAVALAINVGLGKTTGGGLVTIDLDNIPRGKHPGDSGVLDVNGEFVPEKFEAIFANHAHKYGDALTADEVSEFRKANYNGDPGANAGHFVAGLGEFGLLFRLGAQERNGESVLTKDRLHEFYNGDLFDKIAAENKEKRAARAGTVSGTVRNLFNEWIF